MTATLVLVHSPLVGPATWAPVADELGRRGLGACVPARRPPVEVVRPYWSAAADDVVACLADADEIILVGHSGAGPWLPAMGERLACRGHRVLATLFVDAGLPPEVPGRPAIEALPADFAAHLRGLRGPDGLLPPWPEWWPPDTLAELLPDPAQRRAVVSECRPVPADLWDDAVPVPAAWPGSGPCGYLSFTYEADARAAEQRGWIVARMEGHHLQAVVEPAGVADALLLLVGALGVRP